MKTKEMSLVQTALDDDNAISEYMELSSSEYELWLVEAGYHPDDDAPDHEIDYIESNEEDYVEWYLKNKGS